jgi:hypothetical protein
VGQFRVGSGAQHGFVTQVVPEPSSLALLGCAIGVLTLRASRRPRH